MVFLEVGTPQNKPRSHLWKWRFRGERQRRLEVSRKEAPWIISQRISLVNLKIPDLVTKCLARHLSLLVNRLQWTVFATRYWATCTKKRLTLTSLWSKWWWSSLSRRWVRCSIIRFYRIKKLILSTFHNSSKKAIIIQSTASSSLRAASSIKTTSSSSANSIWLQMQPARSLTTPKTLRKPTRIVSKMNKKAW